MYRILLDSSNRDLAVGLAKDNILIDKQGHLKLSDFGLSIIAEDILFPLSSKNRIEQTTNNKKFFAL